MDLYSYLGTFYYLTSIYLPKIGNLHFYLHVHKHTIMQTPIKFLASLPGISYLFVVFMIISILSTSLVLQTFVLIKFYALIFLLLCNKLSSMLGCMQRELAENLIPLDLKIERSLKRILQDKREAARMEKLPMGPMEENRDNNVGSTRGGSIHSDAANMDNLLPPIRDYGRPSVFTPPVIRRPAIQENNFKLKSITLQLLQGIQFHELTHENPNAHILNFLEVCEIVKYNEVRDDAIRLRLFPFSLADFRTAKFNNIMG